MSIKSAIYIPFVILLGLLSFSSCIRDDVEPTGATRQFTRLYVSYEDAPVVNPTTPYVNMGVIYPADSTGIFDFSLSYASNAEGGGPLLFNPYSQVLFQAAANLNGASDTAVYNMYVGTTGVLSSAGLVANRFYTYVKGLAFEADSSRLFVVNGNGAQSSRIQVEENIIGRTQYRGPVKRYLTPNMLLWGATYYDNQLFVSQLRGPAPRDTVGINVFNNVSTTSVANSVDSTATLSYYTLGIENPGNLRGLCYDAGRDILAVASYSGTTVGTGKIFVFTNFSESLTGVGHIITPTRTITGPATLLQQPVEVAIDTRENGVFMYVADRFARRIFRFNIDDDGNVEPNDVADTNNRIPVGLALDTRDESTLWRP